MLRPEIEAPPGSRTSRNTGASLREPGGDQRAEEEARRGTRRYAALSSRFLSGYDCIESSDETVEADAASVLDALEG